MIIIIERTLKYLTEISSQPHNESELASMMELWQQVGPDNVWELEDGTKYVKIES
jgi:hypothetical protein